jgi:large subunit ribosomal protein L33
MAKNKKREPIRLVSQGTDENGNKSHATYWTYKNKKNTTERLELKKYDNVLKKHVVFKEAK